MKWASDDPDGTRIEIRPMGPSGCSLTEVSNEYAADHKQSRMALTKSLDEARQVYGSGVFRHPLMHLEAITQMDPCGVAPPMSFGLPLMRGMDVSIETAQKYLASMSTFAQAVLGAFDETKDVRVYTAVGLSMFHGPYQSEPVDDRALTFYIQQDCDDMAIQIAAVANGIKRAILSNPAAFSEMPPCMLAMSKVLSENTPYYAHVLANPPHEKPTGVELMGHVVVLMAKGLNGNNIPENAFLIEPTAISGCIPGAPSVGVERSIRMGDYRTLFMLADEDSVVYLANRSAKTGKYTDGIDAESLLLGNPLEGCIGLKLKANHKKHCPPVPQHSNFDDLIGIANARMARPCGNATNMSTQFVAFPGDAPQDAHPLWPYCGFMIP